MTAKRILRIASFDGGGKRSFSQLEIMRDIMHRLQCDEYPNEPDKVVLPCERFDLIGGSDIGGLIAIMFVKLKMSVEEAMDELGTLVEDVYREELKPAERTMRLRDYMESLLSRRGLSPELKLETGKQDGCVGFVLAAPSLNSRGSVHFRTYPVPTDPPTDITVVDAVLATCASPAEFLPVSVGVGYDKLEYVGARFGASNPVRQVITEACSYFGGESSIALLLSLGSGHPGVLSITPGGAYNALHQLMQDMASDCEQQARDVQQLMARFGIYFRFSVEQGMQKVHDLAEDLGWISTQTSSYLSHPETATQVDKCVDTMKTTKGVITLKDLDCICGLHSMPTRIMTGISNELCRQHLPSPEVGRAAAAVASCESLPVRASYTLGDRIYSTLKRAYVGPWSIFAHYASGVATLLSS